MCVSREEHQSHAAKCPYLKIKDHKALTLSGQLKLTLARYSSLLVSQPLYHHHQAKPAVEPDRGHRRMKLQ